MTEVAEGIKQIAIARIRGDMPGADFAELASKHQSYVRRAILAGHIAPTLKTTDEAGPVGARQAFELLAESERTARHSTREITELPFFSSWVVDCLSQQQSPETTQYQSLVRRLGGFAAAAAIRAGVTDFTVTAPVEADGSIFLPSLGRLQLNTESKTATIHNTGNETVILAGNTSVSLEQHMGGSGLWLAMRTLTVGSGDTEASLALDDLDPTRNRFKFPIAPRLSEAEYAHWQTVAQDGWEMLVEDHPDDAQTLRRGLRAVVPFAGSAHCSASNQFAFGAVAMSTPRDGRIFGLNLVHEYAHSELNALTDMTQLLRDVPDNRLFYAPWRDDARPVGALLHGVVAHAQVVKFWNTRRKYETVPNRNFESHLEFGRWAEEVLRTTDVLEEADGVNSLGQQLLRSIRQKIQSWLSEDMPQEARTLARFGAVDHEVSWRLHNLETDHHAVQNLAALWQQNRDCPEGLSVPTTIVQHKDPFAQSPRMIRRRLLGQKINAPEIFETLAHDATALAAFEPSAAAADALLVAGETTEAREEFIEALRRDPSNKKPWSGLAMTFFETPHSIPGRALLACPEVVAALYAHLEGHADPLALAAWLEPAARHLQSDA